MESGGRNSKQCLAQRATESACSAQICLLVNLRAEPFEVFQKDLIRKAGSLVDNEHVAQPGQPRARIGQSADSGSNLRFAVVGAQAKGQTDVLRRWGVGHERNFVHAALRHAIDHQIQSANGTRFRRPKHRADAVAECDLIRHHECVALVRNGVPHANGHRARAPKANSDAPGACMVAPKGKVKTVDETIE